MAGEGREFTCAQCGETFLTAWSEEEAQSEADELWGDHDGPREVVCDDCFQSIKPTMTASEVREMIRALAESLLNGGKN